MAAAAVAAAAADDDDDVKVLDDDVNAYNIYLQELLWQRHTEKRL